MDDRRLYGTATTGVLLALTALQRADGVEGEEAFSRAMELWEEFFGRPEKDALTLEQLQDLVSRVT